MALRGVLREGVGGSGVAPFTLDEGPNISFVDASIFGCGVTTNGRAIAACTVMVGVPHSTSRDPGSEQLRLATLAADGRGLTQESGPLGRGIWFEAKGNDRYALAAKGGQFIVVKHWGAPPSEVQIADTSGTNRALATAVLNDRFSAGIDSNGRLIIIGGNTTLAVNRNGAIRKLNWGTLSRPPVSIRTRLIRRLVFRDRRMFTVSVGGRSQILRTHISCFELTGNSLTVDRSWASNGVWTGPVSFEATDLLEYPDGDFVCVGWTTAAGGARLTAFRVSADGSTDNPFIQTAGPVAQPYQFRACVDADGGLLLAATGPNPFSIFVSNLPVVGWVSRWLPDDGGLDPNFGVQGVCWGQHLGYPIEVRGIAATGNGFFLAGNRPASIDSQFSNTTPVVFGFDLTGRSRPGFGETGIVQHDDIPTSFLIHDASSAVAVGIRTVWGAGTGLTAAPNTSELAVTEVVNGNVKWSYGTTHGFHSAPFVTPNGQRANAFWVSAVSRWGPYLAIGVVVVNPAPTTAFITIRNADGRPLQLGTAITVQVPSAVSSLELLPNGALEATYSAANGSLEKVRLVSTPGFMVDPAFPPTPVAPQSRGITLPDGSTIRAGIRLDTFLNNVDCWIYREPPGGGAVDQTFGGGSATMPTGRFVTSSALGSKMVELSGFVTLPNGDYFLAVVLYQPAGPPNYRLPVKLFATAWRSADGASAWPNGFEDVHTNLVTQILPDPPDGVILVIASDALGQANQTMIKRLLVTSGALDPAFGSGGNVTVRLRGLATEHQVARPILDRANGSKVAPVSLIGPDLLLSQYDRQDRQLLLAWLDIL